MTESVTCKICCTGYELHEALREHFGDEMPQRIEDRVSEFLAAMDGWPSAKYESYRLHDSMMSWRIKRLEERIKKLENDDKERSPA